MDHLSSPEEQKREVFSTKSHLVAIICDIEMAYFTALLYWILETLDHGHLKCHLQFYFKFYTQYKMSSPAWYDFIFPTHKSRLAEGIWPRKLDQINADPKENW